MNTVQPIRDRSKIAEMKKQLSSSRRNEFLFQMGINTGLRISDLLSLKVGDVRNRSHIHITEKKTKKVKRFRINESLRNDIITYTQSMTDETYLFKSLRGTKPIGRCHAWKILSDAAKEIGLSEIGTHTLRKTFGYHFYQKTKDVALLQEIFNHSSPSVTLRYIGINQDLMDEAIDDFSL
ncbi:site-specific integrase [Bacillus sp. B-jedd]|uniref:site-specific integrase n=1 Tax=Bacillus sp. B-jedd TaxID=1476857 RepID=UPI000515629B|nr:site-specific integrase [Bacillus sp. B-jedd]CEG25979.1 putative bacteriophage integrase [Bacillus sp. B-jedd]